jgi:hypothetical protein
MVLSRGIKSVASAITLRKFAAPVLSIREKMMDITVDKETGVVTHNHIYAQDGVTKRTFASEDQFKRWHASQKQKMLQHYRRNLTPF